MENLVVTQAVVSEEQTLDPNQNVEIIAFFNADGTPKDFSGSGEGGASAYEVAVANGFEGTEEEWLESLVGPPGTPSEFSGVILTRLSNILSSGEGSGSGIATPVPFTDAWDNSNESFVTWDDSEPADLVVTADGWYWVGANVTTLGTSYTDGTNNSDLTIAILKNYPGSVPILNYMISADRFHNVQTNSAQCNSVPPKPVYLSTGDVVQLAVLNNVVSSTLLESNPGPAMPGAGANGSGPGTLGPHLYVISIPASAVGPAGPEGAAGVLFASNGDPNLDNTVPSPPNELRARAFDVDDDDRLYRWGLADGSTDVDDFTDSDGTNLLTTYVGPNGETYDGIGATAASSGSPTAPAWQITSNAAAGGGDVFHSWFGRDMGSADGQISVVLGSVSNGDRNGLGVRHSSHYSYIAIYTDNVDINIAVVDLGLYAIVKTWEDVGSGASGKVLDVIMEGNVYTVSFDGDILGSFTDVENNYISETAHGVISYQGATTFDNLSWTDAGIVPSWVPTDFRFGSPI